MPGTACARRTGSSEKLSLPVQLTLRCGVFHNGARNSRLNERHLLSGGRIIEAGGTLLI